MFGLGMGEILVLAILGLILIGPEQLPELARTLGRFINDLKRTTDGLTDDLKKQARADIDFDFLNTPKDSAKPVLEEEYKKLVKPPEGQIISNGHNPLGKKMTHNEFGELIVETETPEKNNVINPEDQEKQLSLFPEESEKKKENS